MNILINASNIKRGGGIQVVDSICRYLKCYPEHLFIVILSSSLVYISKFLRSQRNVKFFTYDIRNSLQTLFCGRDRFLDSIVSEEHVDCVLTIFGPSRWNPRCHHVSGFARPHLIFPESPFYARMSWLERLRSNVSNYLIRYLFIRSTKTFYSENTWVSERLMSRFPGTFCYTVTNYYNQIFDEPQGWTTYSLPSFAGITILNVGANYPHKNLQITKTIAKIFRKKYPDIKIRFVLTLTPDEFSVPDDIKYMFLLIGKVNISECPSLYEQADVMLQPSLLECFSATYPEAMRMEVPIVTTDLEFARGLCGDSALYYSPLSAEDASEKILEIINNPHIARRLTEAGKEQLKKFDTYEDRSRKLIELCEKIVAARE